MTLQLTRPSDELTKRESRFVTESLDISLSDDHSYRLDGATGTIGFARKQGNSFIALMGSTSDGAVCVGESLSFDICVSMVVFAYRGESTITGSQ